MKPRILVISISNDLTEKAKVISREFKIPLAIYQGGIMSDGHLYAKKMENHFDVIISQGGTADAIREIVNIPVISIQISLADFLDALLKAKEYGNNIALVSYKTKELDDLENFRKVLDIDFKILPYSNNNELKERIEGIKANHEALTLVNMGSCICELAAQNQINSVLIKSNKKSIEQAVISAKNISDLGKKEKERVERLKAIIDYSAEGIIALDKKGRITILNATAKKILDIKADNTVGYFLKDFNDKYNFDLHEASNSQLGKVTNINDVPVVMNRIPIIVDQEQVGIVITLHEISKIQKLEQKVRNNLFNKGLIAKYSFKDIVGSSNALKETIEQAIRFGKTSTTILINGETGSGKELFAQSIHNISSRNGQTFVAVNCAAMPENLLESELFGYEEGAFTGAKKGGKPGLFELAHKGTIFLDEIGEMPINLQSRLLRVLQEKEVMRLGGDYVLNVDVRIIAATNIDLYKMVLEKKFREDLYYRINVLNLKIPPLRNRKEDIPFLVKHFIDLMNKEHETKIENITDEGMKMLKDYDWPGNVRELENFVERLVILANTPVINSTTIEQMLKQHIPYNQDNKPLYTDDATADSILVRKGLLKDMELQIIEAMSQEIENDKALLAERLGISRSTLWKKLKKGK